MPQAAMRAASLARFRLPSPRLLSRLAETTFWGFFALALALAIGSADWVITVAILGLIAVGCLLLIETKILAMIWLLGQPVLFVFPNNLAAGVPFFTVERGLFLLLLGLMVLHALTRSPLSRPLNRLEWVVLSFIGVLLASFLTTLPSKEMKIVRSDVALIFQCYLMPWLSILIARRIDWTELDVLRLLRLMTLTGVLLVAIGVLQYFLRIQWFTPKYFEVIHEGRTTGTFGNAAEYGSVLGGMAILTLAQFSIAQNSTLRLFLLGCFGAMLGGSLLALTRSPLVGVAVGLIVIFLGDRRIRPFFGLMAILGISLGAILVPLIMDTDALMARMEEMEPIYNRIALFATAGNMIIAYPIIGVGFGRYAFSDYKTDYLSGMGEIGAEWAASIGIPHLEFLHIAVLTGIVGILFYVLAIRACICTLWKIYRSPAASMFARTLAIYVLAVLVSLLVNGLFVDFMAYNYFAAMTYFMVGVASVVRPNHLKSGGDKAETPLRGVVRPS
ncbi:O-antigen ligase family protein [Microvirga terrestris]|uniref:O-antigen ligase family protein n=1 Tax=Microvirga terrestris TaxID=2791024 RepID=A0ABS0HVM7_9HYPH|nr:O-antigen ligase family protein [Microvirga terrestris]MBF9197530.1 O-antigen ligase family protein [Microvirga terrestris]